MRNVFLFIRRYFNFLFFLVLQILALTFLFKYNRSHESVFNAIAGEVVGKINEKYSNVEYYFKLKKTNDALVRENVYLRSLLSLNYESPDTSQRIVVDSIRVDSLHKNKRYVYYDARVVGGFVNGQTNYIDIHRGSKQGLKKDMGVVGPEGIVGRIVDVSENNAVVMSALSIQFKVKAKLKKTGENGTIEWDGASPLYIQMRDIPKSTTIKKGDSVLTSELSSIYPPDILVGTIDRVVADNSSNFYTIKLKTATNFTNVKYVYVIEDLQKSERIKLEESIKK